MRGRTKIRSNEYNDDCSSDHFADCFKVNTFQNDVQRANYRYFLLHDGGEKSTCSCIWVCYTSSRLRTLTISLCSLWSLQRFADPTNPTSPTIDMMSFFCQTAVLASNPQGITPKDLVEQVSPCLQNGHEGVLLASIQLVPSSRLSEVSCGFGLVLDKQILF